LFLGNESIAANLLSHFGSIKALSRASLIELRQFLSKRKAESVLGALRMSAYADVEHAFTQPLDNPEAIYRASMDMRILNQEVLRTVLLNTRYRRITTVDISKGTINESVAHPREIFRPAIVHSAYAFVVVHNHPSGDPTPSDADMRLTRRLAEGARLLQIQMLDHVIVGAGAEGRLGYFSFKETGLI
jgi:DNA repair protein RadC